MDLHKSIKASVDKLTATLDNAPDLSDEAVRVLKLVTEGLQQWSEGKAMNAGYLTGTSSSRSSQSARQLSAR